MADEREIGRTYDWFSEIFLKSVGPHSDVTCAYYNGDYSLTLEQAQAAKHQYMLEAIQFKPGMRVLDIGCGWGPFLKAVNDHGGESVGITLSKAQLEACRRYGLTAHLKDWKEMTPGEFGKFDGIVCVGAFEHFCSVDEYKAGKQDSIYQNFFELCRNILPQNGRLFLQSMVWDKVPDPDTASVDAPKGSDENLLGLLAKFYPGSWLPNGRDQIIRNAEGFQLIEFNSGKYDYIETMKQWGARSSRLTPALVLSRIKLVPKYLTDGDFRLQLASLRNNANRQMFERGIMDHFRMTFEKT